jgi:Ca2+-binding EF-hand superfamily protein
MYRIQHIFSEEFELNDSLLYHFRTQGNQCGAKSADQKLIDDFHNIDVDNNGFISLEELNQASIQEGGDEVTREQWRLMCDYVSAKENVGITFKDFKKIHGMGSDNSK